MKKLLSFLFILFTSLALSSCGGGGYNEGGSSGTGISYGTVTKFGSIYVNGVKFNTENTAFTVDGETGKSQNDLALGMVVAVQGIINGNVGTANIVVAEDVVEGPVDSITGNIITVMGQKVLVNNNSLYSKNISEVPGLTPAEILSNISPGNDIVEISGHVKSPGIIVANFINKKLTPPTYTVKGFVQNSPETQSFKIGSLTIDYSGADYGNMPATGNWTNMLVKVKGDSLSNGILTATKVEPEGLVGPATSIKAEVEGYVTSMAGNNRFKMGTITVQYGDSTLFAGGASTDIVLGAKLEVEGSLTGNTLTASTIFFRN